MATRAYLFRLVGGLTRAQKQFVFLALDAALGPLAVLLIQNPPPDLGMMATCAVLLAAFGLAAAASAACGLPRIKLKAYGRHALVASLKFSVVVACGLALIIPGFGVPIVPMKAMEVGAFMFVGCIFCRYALLTILLWVLRHGQTRCRVLIYGAGDTGQQMAAALRNHQHILPVAFLDDNPDLHAITVAGLPVLPLARLHYAKRDLAANRVLLAMPSASTAKLAYISQKMSKLGLDVQALPSFAQIAGTEPVLPPDSIDSLAQFLGRAALTDSLANLDSAFAGRVVLVSGAGGSVGSELCRQLIGHNPKSLVLYERSEIALYTIDRELRDLAQRHQVQIVPVLGCIADAQLARRTMVETGTEVVFHAAAYKHLPLVEANPVAGLANNVIATRIFAEAAVAAGVARFVLISTDKAIRPTSMMGATKRLAELVILDLAKRSAQTWFSTVRFGNVLGSSGSVLPLFRDQIAQGGPVTLTHDDASRYFMTLAEAARLVLLAGTFPQIGGSGDIYVLDMGSPVKIRDLAERMIKANGLSVKSPDNRGGDIEILVTGLRQGEKLHEELLVDGRVFRTPHPKIFRAEEAGVSEFTVASALNAARTAIRTGDQQAARTAITTWVDGFSGADAAKATGARDRGNDWSTEPPFSHVGP